MPLDPDRIPGDAAPIYLRITQDSGGTWLEDLREKPDKWLDLPLDRFAATKEVRDFVLEHRSAYEQLGFGARRQACNWNYTLPEQREDCIGVMMPDANFMRVWVRVLAVKVRLEIAEHRWDDAARTLETGFAFSQHVGSGPFLINRLVGLACAAVMLERVEEWVASPTRPTSTGLSPRCPGR